MLPVTWGLALVLAAAALAGGAERQPSAEPSSSWGAAGGTDAPSFATYAAPLHRSEYLVDEAYHLRYYEPDSTLALTTDTAGDLGFSFTRDGRVVAATRGYAERPRLTSSLASAATLTFKPFADVNASALVAVWSSSAVVVSLRLENTGTEPIPFGVTVSQRTPGDAGTTFERQDDSVTFRHDEPRGNWSETPPDAYVNRFDNLLLASRRYDKVDEPGGPGRGPALHYNLTLPAGRAVNLRVVRVVSPIGSPPATVRAQGESALSLSDARLLDEARVGYERAMPAPGPDPRSRLVYEQAMNLARQSMLPPEGRTKFNYYVFSREPTWSWGHDGQVFHESLSMLAYAYFDVRSAMDSQRVFIEAQDSDGYMPYRVGPYVVRTFPVKGEKTSSAPFFAWTNWEIYRAARDPRVSSRSGVTAEDATAFLRQSYDAGVKFVNFWLTRRDADHDGLLEWGGNAVLECVRDSLVPIWDQLGKDDPSAPSLVEALDLNAMVVREMRALANSAGELGRGDDAARWRSRADALAAKINETMWDPETRFYYNVDRATNGFSVKTAKGPLDLRRMEIIGFLPLWAGIAPPDRAAALVAHLTNPAKFWRRFGVPTLAADDAGYEAVITRCCQWNGAVWLEWNYLVFDGLRRAGFTREARELGAKMIDAAVLQLERNHRFWESYSPDHEELASPKNYIWDSILARVVIDLEAVK